jgi:transcriptional regulator with XRE-family HTH domain
MTTDQTGLGATIRSWRDRLTPADVGLPSGRARRAAGLRREELAELAGVSVDYVVRLEQGRASTPSAQVVSALARALRLSGPERDHLYRLAGLQPPPDGTINDHIPPGMQRVLTRLGETPVGVFAADWRLIWWNRSWAALLGDPSALAPEYRNLITSRFPAAADPPVRLAGSARFAELWHDGAVGGHAEDRKTIKHPEIGDITVDCDVLNDSDTDLKIVIYTAAPGSEDATKLDLARVAGISQDSDRTR